MGEWQLKVSDLKGGDIGTWNSWQLDIYGARYSIRGTVFDDLNGNGVQEPGEEGISGNTGEIDANNNGSFDTGETRVTTNSNSNYSYHDTSCQVPIKCSRW